MAAGSAARVLQWLAAVFRQLVASVLGTRPVPRHVAFIMDGNRRYAERQRMQQAAGHTFGYQRLIGALEWCLDLGVGCVSVYAFSIDNYHRSDEEVDTLMRLAEDKLLHMLQEQEVLRRHGVRVRVLGDLSLAPPRVQAAAARIMAATAHHTAAVLNICFSYTASREMQQALDGLAAAPRAGAGAPDAAGAALDAHLYTAGCPPVDLLVRTSGETRLSDFLLWQSRHALLVFTRVLWPDFSFLDLVAAVMQYQRAFPALERLRREHRRGAQGARAAADEAAAAALAARRGRHGGLPALRPLAPAGSEGSPCGGATPGSMSPSSRSDPSEESDQLLLAAPALRGAGPGGPALRHSALVAACSRFE